MEHMHLVICEAFSVHLCAVSFPFGEITCTCEWLTSCIMNIIFVYIHTCIISTTVQSVYLFLSSPIPPCVFDFVNYPEVLI